MTTIQDQITTLKGYTTALLATTDTVTGSESANLKQSDFLQLLTQQLQYQDPMDPQDNSEFVSQLCQFSQLNATTEIDATLSTFTSEQKASSLVGQGVVLADPNNDANVIYGKVDAAYLDGSDSGISVNGTVYPLKYLLYTYDYATTAASTNTSNSQ